jgi:hypothetical protein
MIIIIIIIIMKIWCYDYMIWINRFLQSIRLRLLERKSGDKRIIQVYKEILTRIDRNRI